jgi:hypothetical protein
MMLEEAESLFQAYQSLLQDAEKRGARRSPSLLPAGKEEVIRAIRMLVARLYYQSQDTEDSLRPLLQAAMFVDSFSDEPIGSLEFVQAMQNRRRQFGEFYQELLGVAREDAFFWQRVYALAGISCDTKRSTFFEHLKQRLGRVMRNPPTTQPAESVNP